METHTNPSAPTHSATKPNPDTALATARAKYSAARFALWKHASLEFQKSLLDSELDEILQLSHQVITARVSLEIARAVAEHPVASESSVGFGGLVPPTYEDLVWLEAAIRQRSKCSCGATFEPTYGEHVRCPSCLAKHHAAAERSALNS